MKKQKLNKVVKTFLVSILIFSMTVILLSIYHESTTAYNFSKFGIEEKVRVLYTVPVTHIKGTVSYDTTIDLDNKVITVNFRKRLPILEYVSVLVMPNNRNLITLGTKNSSMFDLFAYRIGSYTLAILSICSSSIMLICSPIVIMDVIKDKP